MPRSEIVLGDELGTGQFGVRMNIIVDCDIVGHFNELRFCF